MSNPMEIIPNIRKRKYFLFFILSIILIITSGSADTLIPVKEITTNPPLPFYFIAVHNEPFHGELQQDQKLEAAYNVLSEMVNKADTYGISLTLMFTPQWGEMIGSDPAKLSEVKSWEQNGHEIALHHHSIYHGGWDGYTDYSPEEARLERLKHTKNPEPYLGTLDDMMKALAPLHANISSGCANDERDKTVLPSTIGYDTCSGFLNTGDPGERSVGQSKGKGVNDYVIVGRVNGTEHRWLSHRIIGTREAEREAEQEMDNSNMNSVFGAVTHSNSDQAKSTYKFFEYIHAQDPAGSRSKTISEIMMEGILPEKTLSDDIINAHYPDERVTYDSVRESLPLAGTPHEEGPLPFHKPKKPVIK